MVAVPADAPVTVPDAGPTEAIAPEPEPHVPGVPVVSVSDMVASSQTDKGPAMAGCGFTVITAVAAQPVVVSR